MVAPIYKYMGLDAVEIIRGWENAFDIKLSDAEVFELRTPKQVIDLISIQVGAFDREPGVLLGLRAYHRFRQAFVTVLKVPRNQIQLNSKLCQLLPQKQRQKVWQAIFEQAGLLTAPPWRFGTGVVLMPITIKDIVLWSVANYPRRLINPDEKLTHQQVRTIVRAVITETVGAKKFEDNDDFIIDLGIE